MLSYSDCKVDGNATSPQSQQEQQSTNQPPPSSAQATPLGSKGQALESVGFNQIRNNRRHSMSPRRMLKEREEVQTAHSNRL